MADEEDKWFIPATDGAGQEVLEEVKDIYEALEGEEETSDEATVHEADLPEGSEEHENGEYVTDEWVNEETEANIATALKAVCAKIEDRKKNVLSITQNGMEKTYNTYGSESISIYAPEGYGDDDQALVARGENVSPEWSNTIGGVTLKDGTISTLNGLTVTGGALFDCDVDITGILTAFALSARYGLDYLSWEQISEICKAGLAPTMFHVGQEKHCKITIDGSGNKYDVTFQILGFNHDDLVEEDADYNNGSGKAAITWGLKNCLGYIESEEVPSEENGWKGSLMRKTLTEIYDSYLEDEIKTVLRQVKKQSASSWAVNAGLTETEDYLFLFSHVEVFGTNNQTEDTREYVRSGTSSSLTPITGFYWSGEPTKVSADGEGHQYEFYKGSTWVSPCLTYAVNSFGEVVSRILVPDDSGGQSTVYGYREHRYYQTKSYKAMYDTGNTAESWMTRSASSGKSSAYYVHVYYGGDTEPATGTIAGLVFGMCT